MKVVRQTLKPVSFILAFFMLMISGPFQSAYAVIIGTETVLDSARGQEARATLKQLLARDAVQNALVVRGIDPGEAEARIDSLSEAEAIHAADKFDQLPAASGDHQAPDRVLGILGGAVAPVLDAANLNEPAAVQLVVLRIVSPQRLAGGRIESRHLGHAGGHVDDAVDHQRRASEVAGANLGVILEQRVG